MTSSRVAHARRALLEAYAKALKDKKTLYLRVGQMGMGVTAIGQYLTYARKTSETTRRTNTNSTHAPRDIAKEEGSGYDNS